jgi:dephospho-CoA kinase
MIKKILILGHARHGKDTLAEILNKEYGMTFMSSSQAANEIFLFDELKNKYGYKTKEESFNDRVNHREEWYNMICNYNKNDRSRLAKEIINKSDCYVGMRDYEEFVGTRNLFDIIIWVDASERLPYEIGSFNINKKDADIIIENNGTLEEFEIKSTKVGKLLYS